jgi:dephospho-CoA kinase
VVGLVGQVCAGKSTVADAFRRRGATVWDADKFVAGLYARPDVVRQVRELFGAVFDRQGHVDRGALGRLVFADKAKLAVLTEQVVFPRTRVATERAIAEFRRSSAPLFLLDAPTLMEAGEAGKCDEIVFVAAPLARRQAWAAARGWADGELERREARLDNEEQKRRSASAVIMNDGTISDVEARVAELMERWRCPRGAPGQKERGC